MAYTVKTGDTFGLIARQIYGDDQKQTLLIDANPGVAEPLAEGIVIVTPQDENTTVFIQSAEGSDTVQMFIEGQVFKAWEGITLEKNADGFSQVSFSSPFEIQNRFIRDAFRPFSYASVLIAIDSTLIFSGYVVTAAPSVTQDRKEIEISSYSRAALLSDCMFSIKAKPFQFDNVKLDVIANKLCSSLALRPEYDDDVGPTFEKLTAKPDENAAELLIRIANQRGLILKDNADGNPVFLKSVKPGNPKARLVQGQSPAFAIIPQFNGQAYYSHITAITPAGVGAEGGNYTVENKFLKSVIKPFTFTADESKGSDTETAAKSKLGRMLADSVKWEVSVQTWRDPNGNLWQENTTINVTAPDAWILNETELTIRRVVFQKQEKSKVAVLTLILPEALRNETPESMPWDE